MSMTRAQREKHASDETHVYRHWHRLRERFFISLRVLIRNEPIISSTIY